MAEGAKRRLGRFGLAVVLIVCALVAVTHGLIRSGVDEVTALALQEQPGDLVLSLMAYVESAHPWRDRNRAVWALGRIGDPRALRKAINLCRPTDPAVIRPLHEPGRDGGGRRWRVACS
jgi:hypothetical protein